MMRALKGLLVVATFLALFGHSRAQEMSDSARRDMETEALAGSPEAARKMAQYHFKNREVLFEYWSCIGAENGDVVSQYNCGSILVDKKNPFLRARGEFWLKKAANSGNAFAREKIDSLDRGEKVP